MRKPDVLAGMVGGWVIKCDAENVFDVSHPASGLWDTKANRPRDGRGEWRLFDNYRAALVQPGDRCFFWVSGDGAGSWPAGLWATCDVLKPAQAGRGGGRPWIDHKKMGDVMPYVPLAWHFLQRPVPRCVVRNDPVLAASELIESPQMSNPAALTHAEVQALDHLIATNPAPVTSTTGRGGRPMKPTAW